MICQDDLFVEVSTSVDYVSIDWEAPLAYSCCSSCTDLDSCVTITQIAGPTSGSEFWRQSKTEIVYQAQDLCGNVVACSFDILVDINTASKSTTDPLAEIDMTMSGLTEEEDTKVAPKTVVATATNKQKITIGLAEAKTTKLYPNPVSDYLQVELDNHKIVTHIQLIDQHGHLVINKQRDIRAQNTIDLSNLAKGMYYLQVTYQDNISQTKRVVKI